MVITFENQQMIRDELCIHDSKFTDIQYRFADNSLLFILENPYCNERYQICFENLIYFEMQQFKLWGAGEERVLDWDLIDDRQRLLEAVRREEEKCSACCRDGVEALSQFVYSSFVISSGDTVEFLCRQITFEITQ